MLIYVINDIIFVTLKHNAMIYIEMFINEKGQMDFRNITLNQWLVNENYKVHGWIHEVINRKGECAFYDLYGGAVVKEIHNKIRK